MKTGIHVRFRRPHPAAALGLALFACGCFRQVVRSHEIRVPQMRTEAAAERVRAALHMYDTNMLKSVEIDLPGRIVTVTYHSERVAQRNFERALAVAGFDANDLPADPTARSILPKEMR